MARIKGAMMTRKRRKKTLKLAKGYFGAKSKLFRTAKQAVMTVSYTHLHRKPPWTAAFRHPRHVEKARVGTRHHRHGRCRRRSSDRLHHAAAAGRCSCTGSGLRISPTDQRSTCLLYTSHPSACAPVSRIRKQSADLLDQAVVAAGDLHVVTLPWDRPEGVTYPDVTRLLGAQRTPGRHCPRRHGHTSH